MPCCKQYPTMRPQRVGGSGLRCSPVKNKIRLRTRATFPLHTLYYHYSYSMLHDGQWDGNHQTDESFVAARSFHDMYQSRLFSSHAKYFVGFTYIRRTNNLNKIREIRTRTEIFRWLLFFILFYFFIYFPHAIRDYTLCKAFM